MAHALRYFCSWETEVYKHQMRLELWEKDYEGEATVMVLSGEPQLTMEEGDTICGSSLDFGLFSETNGQYLHLYTTDNHKYLIKILRDGAVMWEGYLLPEYYSEAYIAAPYTVNFTATDWLGMLKNIDFPAEDTRVPILQIIKTCLQYTELPLDFACQMELRVEGINDTTNILGALYLNPITFTGYNCYEVLEKILASFNATLRQTGHRWLISSIDDDVPLRLISWDNLTYTGDGESNNGELIGTNSAGTFIDGSLAMVISPAKKSVDLSQDIFYRESWLKDYDFRSADAWAWPDNTNIVKPGLAYYFQDGVLIEQISVEYLIFRTKSAHALTYLSQVINVEGAPDDSEYTLGIKFFTPNLVDGDNITALWVKIINRSSTSLTQDVAYLSKDGWTNEDSYIELNGTSAEPKYISSHTYNRGGRQYLIYDKENWPTTKINFISIPYTGTLEIRIYPMYLAGFTNVIFPSYYETYFGGVYLTKTNVTKNLTISSSLNPDAAETASSVNLMLCDSPEERNVELGVLNYFSLSNGALTTGKKWYYNNQEYEDFLHAMAYSYSRCYANKRQKLSGALYTDKIYNLCSFTDKWSGKRHIIKSWIYSIISERLDSMEIIETPAKEIELTLSTPEAGSSNKQNQPSGGTSGGGATSMAGSGRYVNLDTAQEVSGEKTWNDKATFKKDIVVAGDGIFGGEVSGIVGEGTPAGVTDYSALTGKPSINGKELASGNNTLDELGIQPKGDYTTASQLATTLDNYATKVFVSNNYATKAAVNTIQALIPATATATNQLADKDFVNSSIATATAEFKGSFTSLDELKATSGNLNDYAFYLHNDSVGNSIVDRYKWTTAGWLYEYTLNNSSFTAAQWAALNSAITATLVQSYNSHLKNTTIHITSAERNAWNNKWDYNEETIKAVKVNAAISADKATKLATARKIWGQSFDGSANVDGDLKDVGNITASGKATIQGDIISGGEVVAVAGEGTPAGVTDYSALTGKPAINGVTLVSGNNTLAALGIQAAGDYATNSGVTTLLANYADKTFVSNNYAGKSAFNAHTADTDIHITAAERAAWNAKWDYSENTIKAVKVNSALSADSVAWTGIKDKPTTIAGYGITDAITTGNIGSQSVANSNNLIAKLCNENLNTGLWNTIRKATGGETRVFEVYDNGGPYAYGMVLELGSVSYNHWQQQLWIDGGSDPNFYLRGKSYDTTSFGAWKQIAFTDSNITGNAASATKLQTPRTIWGQSFDGSANVNGDFTMQKNAYGGTGNLVYYALNFWGAVTGRGGMFRCAINDVHGRFSHFEFGDEENPAYMTILRYGNVLIGTTTDNGYKLDVNGTGHYSDDLIVDGEVVAIVGEGTPAGVTDYSALTGKPQINGVTLVSGNNTLASLGIQAAGDYATNSGVATLLANYADKTFVSNNYVGKAAFNSHTADSDIHITAAERVDWNAKWNYNEATIKAVKVNSALSADSVAWTGISGKPTTFTPSAHTHTASEISGLPTKLSAFTNDVGFITGITKSMVEGVLTGDITSHTHTFASLTSKPTTIAGYGITDAITTGNIGSQSVNYAKKSLALVNNSTEQKFIAYVDKGNNIFYIGDNIYPESPVYILGKEVRLRYGAYATFGLILNTSGNVTIGSDDLASTTTKLYVDGGIRFAPRTIWGQNFDGTKDIDGYIKVNVGVSPDTIANYIGLRLHRSVAVSDAYGVALMLSAYQNKGIIINGGGYGGLINYYDGTSFSRLITFLPSGNVLIGTTTDNGYKLQVNGSERVYGDLIVDGEVSALVA